MPGRRLPTDPARAPERNETSAAPAPAAMFRSPRVRVVKFHHPVLQPEQVGVRVAGRIPTRIEVPHLPAGVSRGAADGRIERRLGHLTGLALWSLLSARDGELKVDAGAVEAYGHARRFAGIKRGHAIDDGIGERRTLWAGSAVVAAREVEREM